MPSSDPSTDAPPAEAPSQGASASDGTGRADDADGFGPVERGRTSPWGRRPMAPKRQRRQGIAAPGRGRRVLRWLVTTALVVVVLLTVGGIAGVIALSARLDRQEVAGLQPSRPLTILVTGSDSREGLTREQQNELTTGSEGGNLTDTIFLLQADGSRTALLAFPRDLLVTRCDGSVGRINGAVAIDGPGCLVETITRLSGIPISHHLEVRFLGFRDIVDAVGGVEVCLERPIVDQDSGLDLPAGCQTLDGVEALGYVRVRKIDNDLERIKRQQRFLKALASEALSADTFTDPAQLVRTATASADAVTADEDLSAFELVRAAWALRGVRSGLDNTHTVPATDDVVGGASVLRMDEAAAGDLFRQFRSGDLLDADEAASEAPELRPSDVEVTVLNGAEVGGLASRVAEQLRTEGLDVADVGNAAEPLDVSEVRHPPGLQAHAQLVADRVPVAARVVEDAAVSRVTLVLGRDAAAVP